MILLDVAAHDSLETVHRLADALPGARLLALGVHESGVDVLAYIEAGAVGYVPSDASINDLEYRIRRAARDEPVASPQVIATLMRRVASLAAEGEHDLRTLTSREHDVIRLIERGLSNREIAEELSIEITTVKNHVHRILEKLSLHRRGQVAALVRTSAQGTPHRGRS